MLLTIPEIQESILQLQGLVLAQVDGFLKLGLLLLLPLLQLLSRQAGCRNDNSRVS